MIDNEPLVFFKLFSQDDKVDIDCFGCFSDYFYLSLKPFQCDLPTVLFKREDRLQEEIEINEIFQDIFSVNELEWVIFRPVLKFLKVI